MNGDARIASRIVASCLALTLASGVAANPEQETFQYRWRLTNFLGALAGLFFPSNGEGVLQFQTTEKGTLISELQITSKKSEDGEFWLYGAEVAPLEKRVIRAWSSYRFRGKDKNKKAEVNEEGVIDIASGIQSIRLAPPKKPTPLQIWSDGKIYPVEVLPRGEDERRIGDTKIETRHYEVRGVDVPGQPPWKGSLELWLAQDDAATPVAILIKRSGLGVLLELDSPL